ncbi:ribosomal maturation YjgA family protein [Chitinophaga nivalis]|uniref:DUF2809 domain-containing protein n=1 Tax=Chitinophaga nivalis TaxID=2991709 RepID=A0ABT3ILJ1_9BACT|nr:DUF2809 domain-containing protein [Chitinophaga nivalis]MCW3465477.1 DUF2809 domain-containing protein [Chitinophaga nivalis]MCW3484832.1 DUF2809 domain-containing protein [Chitinophaga nivalis]
MTPAKKRLLYFILVLCNIPLGLATRWSPQYFPEIVQVYGGDVFSATCIFFGIRFLYPAKPLRCIALINYIVCIAIELQQLYRAPWIVHLRDKTPVGILLGHGFLWSDCICYAVGTLIAWAIGWTIERAYKK